MILLCKTSGDVALSLNDKTYLVDNGGSDIIKDHVLINTNHSVVSLTFACSNFAEKIHTKLLEF